MAVRQKFVCLLSWCVITATYVTANNVDISPNPTVTAKVDSSVTVQCTTTYTWRSISFYDETRGFSSSPIILVNSSGTCFPAGAVTPGYRYTCDINRNLYGFTVDTVTTEHNGKILRCTVQYGPSSTNDIASADTTIIFGSTSTECTYRLCIVVCLGCVIFVNFILTIVLVVKIGEEKQEKTDDSANDKDQTNTDDSANDKDQTNTERCKRFKDSVVLLVVWSCIVFIIHVIVSLLIEECSCNKWAAIGFSIIPIVFVPSICSIIIWISLGRRKRPGKTNIFWARVVASFGIFWCLHFYRIKKTKTKVGSKKYNAITITPEDDPPDILLSCELQTVEYGKIQGFYINYKRNNEKLYKKSVRIKPQKNSFSFKLADIMECKGQYDIYITEIGTGWSSLPFKTETDLHEAKQYQKQITDVKWTHNEQPFHIEKSYIYEGGNLRYPLLTPLLASMAGSGKYVCTVTFNHVHEQKNEKITEIKKYHVDLTVSDKKEVKSVDLLGDCCLLESLEKNKNMKDVQWTHNGEPILTENSCIYKGGDPSNPALTLFCASAADSGEYVCTVISNSNTGTTEIKKYRVDLIVCDQKDKQTVELLQNFTLLEQLHSNEHIKHVDWTHKGNPVQTEISDIYKGGKPDHPALTILYVSNTDFGEYVCTVTFDSKTKAEEKKTFMVNLPASGSLELKNLVKPGQNIQLLKEIKGFTNLKAVQWLHNEQRIDTQNSCLYSGGNTNNPALTISYVSGDVSGEYVCTLYFPHQSDESHPGITKQFVTQLKVEPIAERNVTKGKEVTLIKTLKRNPKDESISSVVWMHNSKKIDIDDNTYCGGNPSDPSLTIRSACLDDSGNYSCTLTFHRKADDQRVEKREFSVSLKVIEKQLI